MKKVNLKLMAVIATMMMFVITVTGCSSGKDVASTSADVTGTYVYEYEEEIGGTAVAIRNEIVLNADHTCELTMQDTITGEWTDTEIVLDNGNSYEYSTSGSELTLSYDEMTLVFEKQ